MTKRRTVKGFLKMVQDVADHTTMNLKGYDKLSEKQKFLLGCMSAEASNTLGEYEEVPK